MKNPLLVLSALILFGCSKESTENSQQNTNPEPEPIYLVLSDNGVTIKATSEAEIGQIYELNGKSYEVINEEKFYEHQSNPNYNYSSTVIKEVVSMECWFSDCPTGGKPEHITSFNQDVSHWDTSSVKNMAGLFANNPKFNQDISLWDVSNVEEMGGMFYGTNCKFNSDISNWDTGSVVGMDSMFFRNNTFTGDISNWDTRNVENMKLMFEGSNISPNISNWDTRNVRTMERMFRDSQGYAGSDMDISGWNTSNVTNMRLMFESSGYSPDVSGWDVSNVTDCSSFGNANRPNFSNCD